MFKIRRRIEQRHPRCLAARDWPARVLYEERYCARGEMENRIKEAQLELFADRTSSHAFRANQLRLWFSSFAYVLIEALRRRGLQQTQFARASANRIRLCLLKIGAVITVSVCRVKVALLLLRDRIENQQLSSILLGASLMPLLGFYDDRWGLRPSLKLIGQIGAAAILIASGVKVTALPAEWVNVTITLLWVVGLTNSLHLLDNMDGLSSGVAAVCASFFVVMAALSGQVYVSALAAALLGATLGFLVYNYNPASIFMGDTGSLFLGFMLAAIGIKLRSPENVPFVTWMVPIIVMGMPIFDTTLGLVAQFRGN